MRISDWSSDVCSSDVLHALDLGFDFASTGHFVLACLGGDGNEGNEGSEGNVWFVEGCGELGGCITHSLYALFPLHQLQVALKYSMLFRMTPSMASFQSTYTVHFTIRVRAGWAR